VSPALLSPTNSVEDIRCFASQVGYPIMVKAVDGGGGRGIRLIQSEDQLVSSVKRAVEESPSKQVFAEKAAIDGFRHIEVQIIGDGTGDATHLWERECSIQRRYQKVVELAPSVVFNRKLIARVIEDALRIAKEVEQPEKPSTSSLYLLQLGPIFFTRYIRIPRKPCNRGVLLPRSKPSSPSRTHHHRKHMYDRYCQSPITHLTGSQT
jgi:pyruvate carboxylase